LGVLESFLSPTECWDLIAYGEVRGFSRSRVHPGLVSDSRTSDSSVLQRSNPLVRSIMNRAADLTNMPIENVEQLKIVRYEKGQEFRMHHDSNTCELRRRYTIFCYLNDVEEGGETEFPHLNLKFKPVRGRALLWKNMASKYRIIEEAQHAGLPPKKGIKYGLNIWICWDTQW
jgi:prolyl 4-hydroxylase